MKNTALEQMELGMRKQIRNVRHERQKRAQWWFTQMRRVVDLALPAQPLNGPRPVQEYLKLQ